MYHFGLCSGDLRDVFIDDFEEEFPTREGSSSVDGAMGRDPVEEQGSSLMDGNLAVSGAMFVASARTDMLDQDSLLAGPVDSDPSAAQYTKITPKTQDAGAKRDILNTGAQQSGDAVWNPQNPPLLEPPAFSYGKQKGSKSIWGPFGTGQSEPSSLHWSMSDALVGVKRNSKWSESDSGHYTHVQGSGCGDTPLLPVTSASVQNCRAFPAQHLPLVDSSAPSGFAVSDGNNCGVASEIAPHHGGSHCLSDLEETRGSTVETALKSQEMLCKSVEMLHIGRPQLPMTQEAMNSARNPHGHLDSPTRFQRCSDKSSALRERSMEPATKHERSLNLHSQLEKSSEPMLRLQGTSSPPQLQRSLPPSLLPSDSLASPWKTADNAHHKPDSLPASPTEFPLDSDMENSMSSLDSGSSWFNSQKRMISESSRLTDLKGRMETVEEGTQQAEGGILSPVSQPDVLLVRAGPCSTNATTTDLPGDLGQGAVHKRTVMLPTTGLPELSPSLQESCLSWERRRCPVKQTSAQSADGGKASSGISSINCPRSGVKMLAGSNVGAQKETDLPAPDSEPQARFTTPSVAHNTCQVHPSNSDIGCKTPMLGGRAPDIYTSAVAKQTVYMPGHGPTPPHTGPHLESEHSPSSGKRTDSAMPATPSRSRLDQSSCSSDFTMGGACGHARNSPSFPSHHRNEPQPAQNHHNPSLPSHHRNEPQPAQNHHNPSLPSHHRNEPQPAHNHHNPSLPSHHRNEPQPAHNHHSQPMCRVPPQASRPSNLYTGGGVPLLTSSEGGHHRMSTLPHQVDADLDLSTSGALGRASNDLGLPMTKPFPGAGHDSDPVSKSIHGVTSDGRLPAASGLDRAGVDLDLPMSGAPLDRGACPLTEHHASGVSELSTNSARGQFRNVLVESLVSDGSDSSTSENAVRGSGEGFLPDLHEHTVHGAQEQVVPGGRGQGQRVGDGGSASPGPGTSDSGGARSRPSYDLQKSVPSTVSFNTPSSLLQRSMPVLPVQAQTWVEMNADKDRFVRTVALEEAQDTLDTSSTVLLVGPPHSGKTTLARALLRCAHHPQQKCCSIASPAEWRQTVEGGQPLRVMLDEVFGRWWRRRDVVEAWKGCLDGMEEMRRQGTLQLVFTLTPQVLRSLRQALPSCPLFSPVHEVHVGSLTTEEKGRMFNRILRDRVTGSAVRLLVTRARCLPQGRQCEGGDVSQGHQDEGGRQGLQEAGQIQEDWANLLSRLVQWVIAYDQSGALFPDACLWFAGALNRYNGQRPVWPYLEQGLKIFSRPCPLYKEVVLQLLQDGDIHAEKLVAVLCLLLGGVDVMDADTIASRCRSLGFSGACSFVGLQSVLQALTSVLIQEGSARFINRHAYRGTALALGQNNLTTLALQVVDWPFLVKRCQVPGEDAASSPSQTEDSLKPFQMEIHRLTSDRKVSPEYKALVRRLAGGLADSQDMVSAVQHPVLQARDFMRDLKAFYTEQNENDVERIFSQTYDSMHEMSLLYWSVFNPDLFLFEWIFKTVIRELKGRFRKEELVKAAYLCCVLRDKAHFLEKLLKYWRWAASENVRRATSGNVQKARPEDVCKLLNGQHLHPSAPPFRLPLPKVEACLLDCWQAQNKHIEAVYNSPTSLQKGRTAGASPTEIESGQSAHEQPRKQKQKSRTRGINICSAPLLVAVEFNNEGVVDLLMKTYADTLTVRDGERRTALHVAVHCGHLPMVRKLLGHSQLLQLKDREGDTALDKACSAGHAEIADMLQAAEEGRHGGREEGKQAGI